MKKSLLSITCASIMALPLVTQAADNSVAAEIEALKQRISELEARQASQPDAASGAVANQWTDRITLSGKAEFLATHSELETGSTNDLDVDAVKLVVDAQVNELISLSTTLKYKEGDEFYVDEAIATLAKEGNPLSLTIGKSGIPFGVIESATWTDPLTDDLTDNTDDLAVLSYAQAGFSSDFYLFKGDQDNDDSVNNAGVNLGYAFGNGLSVGAGYLNNIGNTELFLDAGVDEKQSAWRLNVAMELGEAGISAEWVQADAFDSLAGAKPSVWHLGAHYNTAVFGAPGTLALGYSESDEAADLDLAEKRLAASISRELGDNAELIAEYVREEGYTDEDADTLNLVLATYF
ncbi:LbtU family siderophore porin [Marinobacterium sediminicola]|uniref:Porin n=1 Tax=Marinobacterium sediminicola TaxID=518898 RepID=A0ABY1S3H1_9GAMM|nr:LbtU family siderophore porin [Marinobacterium sediminicola]ULG69265.1 LbtU family siderophore porin [Marinobacterium sediminicola]SMR77614.1 porin [Marinobacterium sediminicola]